MEGLLSLTVSEINSHITIGDILFLTIIVLTGSALLYFLSTRAN